MKRFVAFAAALVLAAAAQAQKAQDKKPAVLFVFDASGSMLRPVDGKPKDQVARAVMDSVLKDLPADRRVGLVTFGHRRKKDCTDLEVLAPIGTDRAAVAKAVADIKVKGETPLAEAIRLAAKQVKDDGAQDEIVIVSDGKDECGGDPCAAAREAIASGIPARIDIVGFDVGKADAEQLQCVAREGKGKYFSAANASQLAAALKEVERQVATVASAPACSPPKRGSTKPITCDCSAAATQQGSVWGTDVYTDDSNVCRAAVHAGAIPASGGKVTVYPYGAQDLYESSERNGIYSSSYNHWDGSFGFKEGLKLVTGICPGSFSSRPTDKPMNCECSAGATTQGSVWGTDVYTADSSLCRAAVHAGVIKAEGGKVTVYPMPGQPAYEGTSRNGIQTNDYGNYGSSIAFRADAQGEKVPHCTADVLENGKPVTCRCRAEETQSGNVWGTDTYTGDSSICRAALHAGLLQPGGGNVTVVGGGEHQSFKGSERNGVTTEDYGPYGSSFSFRK